MVGTFSDSLLCISVTVLVLSRGLVLTIDWPFRFILHVISGWMCYSLNNSVFFFLHAIAAK